MNAWDLVTWLASAVLAVTALLIFCFFLRDAGSILNREMHGHDEDDEEATSSGETPGATPSSPPEDLPR